MSPHQEDLSPTAALLAAQESGRDNPGVVNHQQIAPVKKLGKVCNNPFSDGSRAAFNGHEAGSLAAGRRLLGNQLRRQFVVEILKLHGQ
jgi:hypothetical protein